MRVAPRARISISGLRPVPAAVSDAVPRAADPESLLMGHFSRAHMEPQPISRLGSRCARMRDRATASTAAAAASGVAREAFSSPCGAERSGRRAACTLPAAAGLAWFAIGVAGGSLRQGAPPGGAVGRSGSCGKPHLPRGRLSLRKLPRVERANSLPAQPGAPRRDYRSRSPRQRPGQHPPGR